MLVYTADKASFIEHVTRNEIETRILEGFKQAGRGRVSSSEVRSWRNSLQYMRNVLDDNVIPDNAGVALEYRIPQTSKRIDFILTGRGRAPDRQQTAVIVELKQWEEVLCTDKDGIVQTYLGKALREVAHPSYQAWAYASLITDFNEAVQEDDIAIRACAYLHNSVSPELNLPFYSEYTERAPVFLKNDVEKLQRFIRQYVRYGDNCGTIYRIENGRIRPSKSLADHLASLLDGNQEFVMIDNQKLVYETALQDAEQAAIHGKQVLIVEGGPGTGKSVVAVNLLVELTKRGNVVQYVTRNAAPRDVYASRLAGTMRKTRINNLFKGSGIYTETETDAFDTLIVDEAHRLNEKSGMFRNKGENQVKEIINAAKSSVFFIDEAQQISLQDIGTAEEIEFWANEAGACITRMELQSQFRCSGSDGYLAWLDHILQIRATANDDLRDIDYDFRVIENPAVLREKIVRRNLSNNKSRLVAGYCWDWISKRDPEAFDITFDEHRFAMQWNLNKDGNLWILQDNSVEEIGCIHTCQGLELDYVGVIIGPDLVVREGEIKTNGLARSRNDSTIRGYKKMLREDPEKAKQRADQIIKNTYRTLMTRGMKGCYVWSVDEETNEYFRTALRGR